MKNQCMGLINLEKKGNPNINILNYDFLIYISLK